MSSPTFRAGFFGGCIALLLTASSIVPAAELALGVATHDELQAVSNADYTLNLPAPGRLTVVFNGWRSTYNWGMDIDRMYLYNADGDPVGWESGYGNIDDPYIAHMMQTNDSYSVNVGMAGVYTLRLHAGEAHELHGGAAVQSYTITVTLDEANDINEDNSSIETATHIAIGSQVTAYQWRPTPTLSVQDDEDYYRIELPSPGILSINLDGWVSTLNWSANYDRMYLYTSEGVAFNSAGAEEYYAWMMGTTSQKTVNLASGGVYYIRLHSGNGINTEPYTLQCTFEPMEDIYEPNDQIEHAAPIQSGAEITAYQWRSLTQGPIIRGDEDWYSFTMGEAGTASLAITGWVSTYNWSADYDRLYLYRLSAAPEPVEVMSQHMIGNNFSRDFQLEAGMYAIRLHSGNGTSTTPYTLRLTYPEIPLIVSDAAPVSFNMDQPFPNPFNPETTIGFSLPGQTHVVISIYDISGQRVRILSEGLYPQGMHREIWDGADNHGNKLAAGVYFIRLNAGDHHAVRKVVMVK